MNIRKMNQIGKQVAENRKALKLSQDELASRADVSRTTLWKIEKGEFDGISLMALIKVFRLCGLEISVSKPQKPTVESVEQHRFSDDFMPGQ